MGALLAKVDGHFDTNPVTGCCHGLEPARADAR
jgi:hypothetical protein